jgi:transcriptional regulator with XRE-family HTH domain
MEPRITRFGEKIRHLRKRKGLTLKEVSEKLGLHGHGYLSELETGKKKPTVTIALGLALLFDVSTDVLLKDELEIE